MSTTYETILVEIHERVGLVRINRPKARNALNSTLLHELNDALEIFDSDPGVGAIVVTGDDQAFAAGADIKEMADATSVHMLTRSHIPQFDRIRSIHKPIIAAASGWCLGGGNELAMTCDMIVASETARFGQPEINLGVIPGAGGTQRLTRAVGLGKEAINHAFESFLSDGLADERRAFYLLFASQDQKEGMQAFVEKRKASWKGE